MAGISIDHGTVVVERVLDVPLASVYGAFADAAERARWGSPSDTAAFANLTTVEFFPQGLRTRVKVTVQVASFVGAAMIENTRDGHSGSLANMARCLEQ
jgi:uncharacterized protein YndB with AHSA1/START domain